MARLRHGWVVGVGVVTALGEPEKRVTVGLKTMCGSTGWEGSKAGKAVSEVVDAGVLCRGKKGSEEEEVLADESVEVPTEAPTGGVVEGAVEAAVEARVSAEVEVESSVRGLRRRYCL